MPSSRICREHDAADNVLMFLFTEFGRRVRDNGSGTDHGAGGVAFVIGDAVKGGQYGEYPSRKPDDLTQGDLAPTLDFRGLYATLLEDWLHVEPSPSSKAPSRNRGFSRGPACHPALPRYRRERAGVGVKPLGTIRGRNASGPHEDPVPLAHDC